METNNDARGTQNMGSSDHNNVQHNKKTDDSTSQKDSDGSHTAHNQKKGEEKEVFVPILRTFENDSRHIAKTKGGSELRVLLAREMEQKKLAQQEYIQNTRELLKESLILKDQKRDFLKKEKEVKDTNTTSTASFNIPPASPSDNDDHFTDSIGGAADYVQNIASSSEKKQTPRTQAVRVGDGEDITKELNTIAEEKDSTKDGEVVFHTSNTVKPVKKSGLFGWLRRKKKQTPPQKTTTPPQQPAKNTPAPIEKKQPVSVKKESLGTMMPTSSTQSIKGAPIVGGQQPVSTTKESLDSVQPTSSQDDAPKKTTILDRARGRKRPGDVFTKEERVSMEKRQREIVEKEEMRNKWRDFHVKKEKLREQGFRARDVRSYGTTQPERRVLRKQGIAAIILVILILSALVSTIAFVVVRPVDEPGVIDPKDIAPVKDVVTNEQRVLIDVVSSSKDWNSIMRSRADHYTLTQFIPYTQVEQDNVQITFKEFSEFFALNMPDTLFNTFGEYYFVGNYITPSQVNGVFILAVENYGDALVWMLNWEKNAINAFSQVFPDALTQSQPGTTSTVSRAIDNKDVRILSNPESRDQLLYYFFNRSLLVFIVGEEDAVVKINHRIRSANAY